VRVIRAGSRAIKHAPLAALPYALQGLVAAGAMLVGVIPAGPSAAAAGAVFPLGSYFDVKQALAYTNGWPAFALVVALSILLRGGVLAATLYLSARDRASARLVWRSLVLAAAASFLLIPAAGVFFSAVAVRYAQFAWGALVLAAIPVFFATRSAVRLRPGATGGGVTPSGLLVYVYFIVLLGVAMDALVDVGPWASAIVMAGSGPVAALFFLGWCELAAEKTAHRMAPLGIATLLLIALILGAGIYDRFLSQPERFESTARGTLVLLGGADSTSRKGALIDFRAAWVGHSAARRLLSYRADGPYVAVDTHEDLDDVASTVARQLDGSDSPLHLVGHSQSGLILDRLIARGLPAPARAVDLAPPPPRPPPIEVPPPGVPGVGKPGGDFARAFSGALDGIGLTPFDVDAQGAPANLKPVVGVSPETRRLTAWALGDSVWLYGDWRRAGEVNLVSLSDHVGITRDRRTLDAARRWFVERPVLGDETSWRGALVESVRLLFEPWRPGRL